VSDAMQIPVPELRAHASGVDRVAEDVAQARSAVREVSMDTGAYGQLCQFLPLVLSPVFELAAGALTTSVDELHTLADEVRATADAAEATDSTSARRVDAVRTTASLLELPL
jgi:hypothetical protein